MRTCTICGCYIPDNWTTCPACHNVERKISTSTKKVVQLYKVNVLYDYSHNLSYEFFGQYENAVKYAQRKANETGVYATQIVFNKIIINQFSKNT